MAKIQIFVMGVEAATQTISFKTTPVPGSFLVARGNDVWINFKGTAAVKRTVFTAGVVNEGDNESLKLLDGQSFSLTGIDKVHVIADSATNAQIYCVIKESP